MLVSSLSCIENYQCGQSDLQCKINHAKEALLSEVNKLAFGKANLEVVALLEVNISSTVANSKFPCISDCNASGLKSKHTFEKGR